MNLRAGDEVLANSICRGKAIKLGPCERMVDCMFVVWATPLGPLDTVVSALHVHRQHS